MESHVRQNQLLNNAQVMARVAIDQRRGITMELGDSGWASITFRAFNCRRVEYPGKSGNRGNNPNNSGPFSMDVQNGQNGQNVMERVSNRLSNNGIRTQNAMPLGCQIVAAFAK